MLGAQILEGRMGRGVDLPRLHRHTQTAQMRRVVGQGLGAVVGQEGVRQAQLLEFCEKGIGKRKQSLSAVNRPIHVQRYMFDRTQAITKCRAKN